jgi:fucose 4-O-acetylase-like acetyltransferase
VAALGGVLVLALFTDSWISTEWYYYRSTYADMDAHGLHAVVLRAAVLSIGLLGAAAAFALVPRGRSWFSTLGAATIVVYLFHGFFVLLARYRGYPDWAGAHPVAGFAIATVSAIGLALLLAAPPVARRLNVAVDPLGALQRRLLG